MFKMMFKITFKISFNNMFKIVLKKALRNTLKPFLPLGLKAQRGIAIMVAGGWSSGVRMSVVTHFFVQFFSYDPEISHECSPP